jgi:TetR/AcrR family acrAB operon transcriptional repressor
MAKSDNDEREERILAAATELFVYYGYDKTTVSDIARSAGISKGAVYLHFDSKDDLFEAVMVRELGAYTERWFDLIEADSQGGTIGGMYKNSLYALNASDFMAAMFKRDSRVLGNYVRKPGNLFMSMRESQETSPRLVFVRMMQEAGAMRQDMDPAVIAHIMDMLAYGLVAIDDIVPKEQAPPMEDVIEGIAAIMDRALTPADGGNSEAGKIIIRQIAETARQRFEATDGEPEEIEP